MRGQSEFMNLCKEAIEAQVLKERMKSGKLSILFYSSIGIVFKHKCLRQMNARNNFLKKGFRPLSVKLLGHTDMIRGVDGLNNYVLSGAEDNKVKLWNIKSKKCTTYTDHINWVTKVLLLDNYAISGSADRSVRIRPIDVDQGPASFYKHDGWITCLKKLNETSILSASTDGKLIAYDCKTATNLHT